MKRLPASAHISRPWRIHELTGDFRHLAVYPALLGEFERSWQARADARAATRA